jgi:DNA-binding NarL/FixJ family response regulator
VAQAACGFDAVRLASSLRPDLIVMDVRLRGGIDGIEAARLIQAETPTRLLFITGQADASTVRRADAIGAPGYLLKPFSDDDLRQGVQACLERPPCSRG